MLFFQPIRSKYNYATFSRAWHGLPVFVLGSERFHCSICVCLMRFFTDYKFGFGLEIIDCSVLKQTTISSRVSMILVLKVGYQKKSFYCSGGGGGGGVLLGIFGGGVPPASPNPDPISG